MAVDEALNVLFYVPSRKDLFGNGLFFLCALALGGAFHYLPIDPVNLAGLVHDASASTGQQSLSRGNRVVGELPRRVFCDRQIFLELAPIRFGFDRNDNRYLPRLCFGLGRLSPAATSRPSPSSLCSDAKLEAFLTGTPGRQRACLPIFGPLESMDVSGKSGVPRLHAAAKGGSGMEEACE